MYGANSIYKSAKNDTFIFAGITITKWGTMPTTKRQRDAIAIAKRDTITSTKR